MACNGVQIYRLAANSGTSSWGQPTKRRDEEEEEGGGVQLVSLAGGKQFLAITSGMLHNITKGNGR